MADEEKHTYQSETLGLPPLQMILVHTKNDPRDAVAQALPRPRRTKEQIEKEKIVLKLIEHFNKKP
jgi:hypothetical protein